MSTMTTSDYVAVPETYCVFSSQDELHPNTKRALPTWPMLPSDNTPVFLLRKNSNGELLGSAFVRHAKGWGNRRYLAVIIKAKNARHFNELEDTVRNRLGYLHRSFVVFDATGEE